MASSKFPEIVKCRICKVEKGIHSITQREGRYIIYYSVCSECRKKFKNKEITIDNRINP